VIEVAALHFAPALELGDAAAQTDQFHGQGDGKGDEDEKRDGPWASSLDRSSRKAQRQGGPARRRGGYRDPARPEIVVPGASPCVPSLTGGAERAGDGSCGYNRSHMITVPQRKPRSVVVDAFLTLCAADTINGLARQPGKTLFHKILFAARMRLGERSEPRYSFIRHHFGPYSPDLAQDLDDLARVGLLRAGALDITPRGRNVVEAFRPDLERANRSVFRVLHEEARKRAGWSAARAKTEAYERPVRVPAGPFGKAKDVKLRNLAQGVTLQFDALDAPDFKIPDDVLAELAFDLSMSAEDVRRARTFSPASSEAVRDLLSL